jgi:transposase
MKLNKRTFARGPTRNLQQRLLAIRLLECGNKVGVVAREIGVSPQTIFCWKKRYAETGDLTPRKAKGHPQRKRLQDAELQRIREHVLQFPKTTISQLCALVDNVVGTETMGRYLRSLHLQKSERLKIGKNELKK